MIPAAVWQGDGGPGGGFTPNAFPLFDGAYYANTWRPFFRHDILTEYNNPANIQGGRVNGYPTGQGPYPTSPIFTLTSALTVGPAITSLPGTLTQAVAAGDKIVLVNITGSSENEQSFTVASPGAPAGASAIPINSTAPTFAYQIGDHGYSANGPVNQNGLYGVLAAQTLTKWVARGATSPFSTYVSGIGGAGAGYQKGSATIFGYSFEDNYQFAAGNNFNAGGGWFVSTVPKGNNMPEQDMFGFHANGISATLNATLTRNGFVAQSWGNWGDMIIAGHGYSLGRFTALQNGDGSASNTAVVIGDVGPSNVAGLAFSTALDTILYRGGAAQLRTPGDLRIDGKLGLNNNAPVAQGTITGAKGGNAALASLLTYLASRGDIIDNTT